MQSIKVEYEYDKKLAKDVICEIKIIDTGLANFTVGGTLLNEANDIKMKFQIFIKKNKKFVPHLVSGTLDICDLNTDDARPDNFIRNILPNIRDVFASILRPCPYSVSCQRNNNG
jgi:hypothetical protein